MSVVGPKSQRLGAAADIARAPYSSGERGGGAATGGALAVGGELGWAARAMRAPLRYWEDFLEGTTAMLGPFVITRALVDAWGAFLGGLPGLEPQPGGDEVPQALLHSRAGGEVGLALGFSALLGIRHARYRQVRRLRAEEPYFVRVLFSGPEVVDERVGTCTATHQVLDAAGGLISEARHDVLLGRRP